MRHMLNFAAIVCRVYKGSVRFITIETAFKKLRENVINPINKQEHFDKMPRKHKVYKLIV